MNAKNPETQNVSSLPPTEKSRNPLRRVKDSASTNPKLATAKSVGTKVLVGVGVLTVAGVVAGQIAKKKSGSVTVEASLPDVDVTTDVG